ncbi:putative phage tail component-like protein [Bacillus thermophilus]|uniref:Phage tail component-like protein n=1 Tax=Siminovitchia thermophila TaxID=1245522 RepID=A0ABS2RC21_9BACI|nr:distal tail protein Dit [Siminovitchia thermophila]MBM7717203.1 putative phage tail component-like protein [Siminovitchia thermophila]
MLNYDNFNFSPYLTVNDIKRPILPPQSLATKTILGRDGAYFFQKQHEPIILPVSITVIEETAINYRERIRFLSGKLNKREPKPIVFSDEPNMFIEGIIQDTTEMEEVLSIGQGDLNFFCPDPFYYAIEDEIFTFKAPGTYSIVRNKGNTESLPIIEIKGTNALGAITVETDNAKITFDGKLSSGEILVFDSKYITSYILQTDGKKRSANNDIDSMTFPYFEMGSNNIKVATVGDATVSEIKVHSKSRWT